MTESDNLPETTATGLAATASSASTDLIPSVTKLDRAVKQRRDTDVQLVNWWLYTLLLSWVTFGIYSLYLYFKRIARIDQFSERKHSYYDATLEWTERWAARNGQEDAIHQEVADLRADVTRAYQEDLRPIKAGLSFVLTLITLGIYGFYVLYRVNKYWWDAQVMEQDFDDKLSQTWIKLNIMRYQLDFPVDQRKRRSYALYLVLSIVTFGIWGLVWDYKVHTDPDNLYGQFHGIEDTVLQTIRAVP
jgi:Domain of unknown function (DUF4234)